MSAYALSDMAETSGAAFNGGRNNPRKNVKILNERQKRPRKSAASICGDQNAKDACHNSLLGADCSVVNPSGHCSGTSSRPQGKPQTGHGQ